MSKESFCGEVGKVNYGIGKAIRNREVQKGKKRWRESGPEGMKPVRLRKETWHFHKIDREV